MYNNCETFDLVNSMERNEVVLIRAEAILFNIASLSFHTIVYCALLDCLANFDCN